MNQQGSIAGLFFETAARFGDRPFLHAPRETRDAYRLRNGEYTYAQALARIRELGEKYQRAGCGPGVRVGLAFENRPEFFLHFLAVNALGASVMPLNCGMPRDELARQISHSDCALIVATPAHAGAIEDAARLAPSPPPVITPDREAFAAVQARHAAPDEAAASLEAAILYTSGTTGEPKGCLLSNDYFLAIGDLYTELGGYVRFEAGRERIITPLPVTHMNALACSFMAAIRTGSCLVQLDRFHPKSWWRTVRENRATVMHYLGVMPAMLLRAPVSDGDDFSGQLKFAFGAGCDPAHHAEFERRFGVPLIEAWAMTETGAGAWIAAAEEPRHVGTRCFGKPPAGLGWRLIDEEGRDAPAGAPGELLVRRRGDDPRRHFFSGYYKDAAATEDAWRGGWFHTGDVVQVGADGSFHFVDRRKNVIRRSGENIAAIEVESVIGGCDGVAACVVAPVPDDLRGEEVMALVVAADGDRSESRAQAIFDAVSDRLIYFKAPGHIAFIDRLPMTATEKIKRGEAKEIARRLVEIGGAFDFTARKKPRKAAKGALRQRQSYAGVVAAAPVTVAYERYSARSAHWWIGRALKAIADKSGVRRGDIDGFCASSFTLHPDHAVALTQHFGLSPRWLDHIPMGGASGIVALRRAARAVQSGDAEIVACVAGDTHDRQTFACIVGGFSRFSQDASLPYGAGGPNAQFALITRAYMNKYGATREDFGRLCVAQRENALKNPAALMKTPLRMEDYLAARPVADPLHLFDCVMPCAGAEGFLVMREERAKELGLSCATILSTIERHNAFAEDPVQLRGGWAMDNGELWSMAGVAPKDVDFAETYDDYPVISFLQFEDLGFCAKGEAKDFVRARRMTVDGDFPHNTSGGQLSVGQAGAAGGYLGLVEALRQLTGDALGAAVPNARVGVVSGFGMINYDRGVCTAAAILAAGGGDGR